MGKFVVNVRHRAPYAIATYTVTDDDQWLRSFRETDNVPMVETVIWEEKRAELHFPSTWQADIPNSPTINTAFRTVRKWW